MEAARLMVADRIREAAVVRGEELIAEVPRALRRLGLLLLVLAFSVPIFLAGCLALVAWWLLA
jgi:hypothetical protein